MWVVPVLGVLVGAGAAFGPGGQSLPPAVRGVRCAPAPGADDLRGSGHGARPGCARRRPPRRRDPRHAHLTERGLLGDRARGGRRRRDRSDHGRARRRRRTRTPAPPPLARGPTASAGEHAEPRDARERRDDARARRRADRKHRERRQHAVAEHARGPDRRVERSTSRSTGTARVEPPRGRARS